MHKYLQALGFQLPPLAGELAGDVTSSELCIVHAALNGITIKDEPDQLEHSLQNMFAASWGQKRYYVERFMSRV